MGNVIDIRTKKPVEVPAVKRSEHTPHFYISTAIGEFLEYGKQIKNCAILAELDNGSMLLVMSPQTIDQLGMKLETLEEALDDLNERV
jgi:hypothetical protein